MKGRGTTAARGATACCIAVLLASAAGCTPRHYLRPPAPEECPRTAAETMREELQLKVGDYAGAAIEPNSTAQHVAFEGWAPIDEGPAQAVLMRALGKLPAGTVLGGRVLFGTTDGQRAFIRYTWAQPPESSKRYAVCLRMRYSTMPGLPVWGEKFADAQTPTEGNVEVVTRFNEASFRAE